MDAKEEIRARLAIEDIIGEYVLLKRAGRSWKGLSPFSSEKTPSFFVVPDKQIWHDFSSNKGGDIFSFVMEVEGLDFRGSLELLARKAGVDLSLYQSGSSKDAAQKKQRLLSVLDMATHYYQRTLVKDKLAINYAKQRGLNAQIVHDFRIGYAPPSGYGLSDYLRKKGVTDAELKSAGLVSQRRSGVGDMFRQRLTVPLADGQGQVIGFTARLIGDIDGPKYINTPQTLLYDKGRHVFGLHLAKGAIRKHDYVVVVEGNLDVISSHQAGVTQVVATAGTALTEFHLKALSRLTHHIRLAFDADKAGIAATERAIPIAERVGVDLSIIQMPDGAKDPDELIQQDVKLWQKAIDATIPAVEWVIAQYAQRVNLGTAAGKRELTTAALTVIRNLDDAVERDHYMATLAELTGASKEALQDKFDTGPTDTVTKRYKAVQAETQDKDRFAYQDFLLGLALYDDNVHDALRKLQPSEVEGDDRQAVLGYLLDHLGETVTEPLPPQLQNLETYVKIVLFKAETRYERLSGQDRLIEAASLVRHVRQEHTKRKKQTVLAQLRDAEDRHDEQAITRHRRALNELIKENRSAR